MARSLVIANWKMNPPSWREAKKLLEETKHIASIAKHVSIVVAPPALYLRMLAKEIRGGKVEFAAQNAHFEPSGAHTGEISMQQAKEAGASYVLVGHSEARAHGETNSNTGKQVASALLMKMRPILCVGETDRSTSGAHFNFVSDQLKAGFERIPNSKISRVIVAYEPVWAIGGEKTMSPREMHEMAIFIRKTIVELHGAVGHKVKILYGGSANEENSLNMLHSGDVSGLLVGHVSIDIVRFAALIHSLADRI